MKTKLFFALLLTISCCYFKSMAQTPILTNNRLSAVTDSVYKMSATWGTKLSQIELGDKQFINLAPYRLQLQLYISLETMKLSVMHDIGGSYNFRQSVLNYLKYEREAIDKRLKPFERLDTNATSEDVKKLMDLLVSEAAKEQQYMGQVRIQQNEYVRKNNLKFAN